MSQVQEMGPESETSDKNFKSICVTRRGDMYYYPKTIPRRRSLLTNYICMGVSVVLFLVYLIISQNPVTSVLAVYALGILMSIGLQFIKRIILLFEEFKHIISRYEASYINLFKYTFTFSVQVVIAFVLSVIYCVYFFSNNSLQDYQISPKWYIFLVIPSVYLIGIVLKLDASPLNDSLWVAENNGLDYGSGMAHSFFHGYLKLVLPKTGTEEKYLKELMKDYEAHNDIKFAAYKLFVLIPKSLNCFVSLENNHCKSISEASSLPHKTRTVAGVKDRVYKNAVYKITSPKSGRKIYVSAEYATPLKTFKDVVASNGDHRGYYEKHRNDIILQFHLTLQQVLEKEGLNDFCELIYYEDSYFQDGQLKYYDVGRIILKRLKELKKFEHDKNDKFD